MIEAQYARMKERVQSARSLAELEEAVGDFALAIEKQTFLSNKPIQLCLGDILRLTNSFTQCKGDFRSSQPPSTQELHQVRFLKEKKKFWLVVGLMVGKTHKTRQQQQQQAFDQNCALLMQIMAQIHLKNFSGGGLEQLVMRLNYNHFFTA